MDCYKIRSLVCKESSPVLTSNAGSQEQDSCNCTISISFVSSFPERDSVGRRVTIADCRCIGRLSIESPSACEAGFCLGLQVSMHVQAQLPKI